MQTRPRTYTPGEYLALEETAEFRNDYCQGKIIPMTGGSFNHNELVTNLVALLKPVLRQHRCRLYSSNVRLWIPRYGRFTCPDAMVVQGEPTPPPDVVPNTSHSRPVLGKFAHSRLDMLLTSTPHLSYD